MEQRNQPEEVVPEQTPLQEMDKEGEAEEETSEQNTSKEEEENEEEEEEENKQTSPLQKLKPLRGSGRRTKISRGGAVKYKGYCENCFCLETARWRKGRRGETFCDKCGWAEREHKYVLMGNMRKQGMTSVILDMLHNSAITFVLPALMGDGETQRAESGATMSSSSSSSSSSVKESSMRVEHKEKRNEGEEEEEENDRADELRPLRKKRKEDNASGKEDKEEEDIKDESKDASQEHSSLAVATPTTSPQ